jgi:hypothetical protein
VVVKPEDSALFLAEVRKKMAKVSRASSLSPGSILTARSDPVLQVISQIPRLLTALTTGRALTIPVSRAVLAKTAPTQMLGSAGECLSYVPC